MFSRIKRGVKSFFSNLTAFLEMLYRLIRMLFVPGLRTLPKLKLGKVLIVGNGPSAAKTDLYAAKAAGYELLCVNWFANNRPDFLQLKPRYYCSIDQSIYSEKEPHRSRRKALCELLEQVDWPMTYICLDKQDPGVQNPWITVVKLASNEYRGKWLRYALYRRNLATISFINVTCASMHFCLTGHAEAIALTGADTDWHKELTVDENNIVYRECVHFYGVEKIRQTGSTLAPGELYRYFEFYANTLRSFYDAAQYARVQKIPVCNLGLTSYIDVFPKCRAEELFGADAAKAGADA